jgi:hypothetical protein
MIRQELFSWDVDVSAQYLSQYPEQLEQFVTSMAVACRAWKEFDETVRGNEKRAHVSSLIFGALSLHLMSTKLLIWGLLVPAGNTMRQVLEVVSMAFLASKSDLGFLDRYSSGKYSTNLAVRDVLRNAARLNLIPEALDTLKRARDFYDKFSHPTLMTIATLIQFGVGDTYLGASFDLGKKYAYDKEVSTRVQVARLLENMIQGIRHNLGDETAPSKRSTTR